MMDYHWKNFARFHSLIVMEDENYTCNCKGNYQGRLRVTIFKSADTAYLIASPKQNNNREAATTENMVELCETIW